MLHIGNDFHADAGHHYPKLLILHFIPRSPPCLWSPTLAVPLFPTSSSHMGIRPSSAMV